MPRSETLTGELKVLVDAYGAAGHVAFVRQHSRTISLDGGVALNHSEVLKKLKDWKSRRNPTPAPEVA